MRRLGEFLLVALCLNLWFQVILLVRSIFRQVQGIERQEARKE